MGTFDIHAPINCLGSTSIGKNISMIVDRTNPWGLPSQKEPIAPLSTIEVTYKAIFDAVADYIMTPLVSKDSDEAYFPS